jgi:hypothetical protein
LFEEREKTNNMILNRFRICRKELYLQLPGLVVSENNRSTDPLQIGRWASNQPTRNIHEECMLISGAPLANVEDAWCTDSHAFVCERGF